MLGTVAQQAGVLVNRFFRLNDPVVEGSGPVVHAPGSPDADALGAAPALPAVDDLRVIDDFYRPF